MLDGGEVNGSGTLGMAFDPMVRLFLDDSYVPRVPRFRVPVCPGGRAARWLPMCLLIPNILHAWAFDAPERTSYHRLAWWFACFAKECVVGLSGIDSAVQTRLARNEGLRTTAGQASSQSLRHLTNSA